MAYIDFLLDHIYPGYIKEHSLKVSAQSDLIYGKGGKGKRVTRLVRQMTTKIWLLDIFCSTRYVWEISIHILSRFHTNSTIFVEIREKGNMASLAK